MGEIRILYGTSNQAITVTLNSLAAAAARAGASVSNTTNKFQDVLIQLIVRTAAGTVAAEKAVKVYAYGTVDGATTYSDNAVGTDVAHTLTVPPNTVLIGIINVAVADTIYESHPFSLASAFGGVVPDNWGIIVENQTGLALNSAGNSAFYQGIKTETA